MVVVHRTHHFWVPSPLAPWGHSSVPSDCYVCSHANFMCGVWDVRSCPPGEPNDELGVWGIGPISMVRLGVRNQSVVVVSSLLRRAP
jgi:hypothetical protein